MMDCRIEDAIRRELHADDQRVALAFVQYLRDNRLSFYRDSSGYWKDKSYFWIQWENQCVGFIATGNPEEKNNRWTVWSADMGSEWLAEDTVEPCIRETAWKYIDHCGRCGSCSGGQRKVIFGKAFEDVCGCTFRLDNPQAADLPFLMKMVEIRLRELRSRSE